MHGMENVKYDFTFFLKSCVLYDLVIYYIILSLCY